MTANRTSREGGLTVRNVSHPVPNLSSEIYLLTISYSCCLNSGSYIKL